MKSNVKEALQRMRLRGFLRYEQKYDENEGMIAVNMSANDNLSSCATGVLHDIRQSSFYVGSIFGIEKKEYYDRARAIIKKICLLQDKNPESRTYGLWARFTEEPLSAMKSPDYNWAEFVSGSLISVMKKHSQFLDEELTILVKETLRMTAYCCMKRKVGLDYTNVIFMSIFTLLAIGEIVEDKEIFEFGKKELRGLLEYTRVSGGLSEYNSPCYTKLPVNTIGNILDMIDDDECKQMAEELNCYVWDMISKHYSNVFHELTPPYSRNYGDIDNQEFKVLVWFATDGRCGKCFEEDDNLTVGFSDKAHCPEKYIENFGRDEWVEDVYYKKNDLRELDSEVTIIRDFESPDLTAYSYKTDEYLFGAFQKTDLWDQRKTLEVIWDKDDKKVLKLAAYRDDDEFSSAMSYAIQDKNKAVSLLGYSTDHGYRHYILDLFEDGKISAKTLIFRFKTGEAAKGMLFKKASDNEYVLNDGKITISIKVAAAVFDGEPADVRITDKGLEFVMFESCEEREINLKALGDTYAVISMAVNETAPDVSVKTENGKVFVYSDEKECIIEGYSKPHTYNECIRNTVVSFK